MKLQNNWKLYFICDKNYQNNVRNIKSFDCFDNVNVPTMFELELYRNGVEGHPYYSTNNWDYQKYEDYHQFYVLNFKSNKKHKYLRINGIDTISEIYVNGKLVGKTRNMFIPYVFELKNLKKENELLIHILPSVLEGQKFDSHQWYAPPYSYESLYLRKTPSSFGWDILPRTPLGGIYKDIELLDKLPIIEDVQVIATDISKEKAKLSFKITAKEKAKYRFEIDGKCLKHCFHLPKEGSITLHNPYLWNIRGYGKPYLYQITVKAYLGDKLVEIKRFKYGIRKVELKRSSIVEEGGSFEFHINNQKVFLMGANWVPTDAIKHIDDERMLKILDMILDLNCNSIRVWGGGTYESDLFYEKCDELGILVWQDFMMGCAVYPQDEYFQELLREETNYIVKHLRNHPSICLWAGDNENDLAGLYFSRGRLKPSENVLTRKVIPEVIDKLDPTRPYIPSSPYIDLFNENNPKLPVSEDHIWGPRDYFKSDYYRNAYPYFTSEVGYHAMNNIESLEKYLKKPWPIFENYPLNRLENSRLLSDDNRATAEHRCHCVIIKDEPESTYEYRTRLMANQVFTLFTNDIDNLQDFVNASQISQAEAMKFFIEKMRRDYQRNGGIIWWDIIDGWPQPADSIVDYYFAKKFSYYYIKCSQQPTILLMNEDEDGLNFYCTSMENKRHIYQYSIIDAYKDEVIDEGMVISEPRASFKIKSIKADYKTLLIIKYKDEKGVEHINHFHTHIKDIDLNTYMDAARKYKIIDR